MLKFKALCLLLTLKLSIFQSRTIVWPPQQDLYPQEEGVLDPEIESLLSSFSGNKQASFAKNDNPSLYVDRYTQDLEAFKEANPNTPNNQLVQEGIYLTPGDLSRRFDPKVVEWPGFDGSLPQVPGFMGESLEESMHPQIGFQSQDPQEGASSSDLGHHQQSSSQELSPSHKNVSSSKPSSSEELEKFGPVNGGPVNEGRTPLRLELEYTAKPYVQEEVQSTHQFRPSAIRSSADSKELPRTTMDERAAAPIHTPIGSRPNTEMFMGNFESQPNQGGSSFNPADVVMHNTGTQFERGSTTPTEMVMQNTDPRFQSGSSTPTDMSMPKSESQQQFQVAHLNRLQFPRIPHQSPYTAPWYTPHRVNCRPVEKVVKVQQCEPYTVETCWEEAKQECNPQPVTNCKGVIDTRLEQVCFNVVDELCTLMETVESEKTEDSYQTQHCFFGHEAEVCGVSYDVQKFDKDDYGCTTIDVLSCRQVPQYVHDVNCIESVEFECKEDGFQPNTLLPEIKCKPNPTNNCYKIPRKVYTEACEVVPRRHCEAFNNIHAMPVEKEVCKPYTKKACDFKIETSPKISKKFKYEQVCRPKSREICEHVETKTITPDCETSERLSCKYVQWAHQCKYDPKHYCHLVDKVVEEEVCDTVYGFA